MSFFGDPPSSVPDGLDNGSNFLLPPIIVLFFKVAYPLKSFPLFSSFSLNLLFLGENAVSSTISLNLTEGTVISMRLVVYMTPVYSAR
jgi:hypothetical protein